MAEKVLITRRAMFIDALGPEAEPLRTVDDTTNRELLQRIDRGLRTGKIVGRVALFANLSRFQHGSPKDFATTGGILRPNIPLLTDHKGRKFPHGPAAVCAAVDDVETVMRRGLLHETQPALADCREQFGFGYFRRSDSLGRVWHFTTQAALNALRDAETQATAYTWGNIDIQGQKVDQYFDSHSGIQYPEVRFPHEIKVREEDCYTLTMNDLVMDPQSLQERPCEDLFVVDAPPKQALEFMDRVPSGPKFLDIADEMNISVQPLSASYYPRELHMYS